MPKEGNPLSDPDVLRAAAIISGAKDEAKKLIRGESEEMEAKRADLTSQIIDDVTRRNGLNSINGQSRTNREVSKEKEATL